MNVRIQAALGPLNANLAAYMRVTGKAPAEVLAKQGTKLGFELSRRLLPMMPAKGAIAAERIAALKEGKGIRVRESVTAALQTKLGASTRLSDKRTVYGNKGASSFRRKGNRVNFQALAAKSEIALRERGRGYTSHVGRVRGIDQLAAAAGAPKTIYSRGRYNQILASAGLSVATDGATLLIVYGSSETAAGKALRTPRSQREIVASVDAVTRDVGVYLARKLATAGGGR